VGDVEPPDVLQELITCWFMHTRTLAVLLSRYMIQQDLDA